MSREKLEGQMIRLLCRDVSAAAAQGRTPDTGWDRLRLFIHLAVCQRCRRFRAQMRLIESGLRRCLTPAIDDASRTALERAILARLGR
jgi:hypothetical protein